MMTREKMILNYLRRERAWKSRGQIGAYFKQRPERTEAFCKRPIKNLLAEGKVQRNQYDQIKAL